MQFTFSEVLEIIYYILVIFTFVYVVFLLHEDAVIRRLTSKFVDEVKSSKQKKKRKKF